MGVQVQYSVREARAGLAADATEEEEDSTFFLIKII